MHDEAYRSIADMQNDYWWHKARAELTVGLIGKYGPSPVERCLDLGCGPGGLLKVFRQIGAKEIVGFDRSPIAMKLAARECPEAKLVRGDLNDSLPFPDSHFDVVSIFGVLYHEWVKDEAAVISEVKRVLKPGGILLLVEPAFPILERRADAYVMGARRYRLTHIHKIVNSSGLHRLWGTYFSSFAFPIALLVKWLESLFVKEDGRTEDCADMKPTSAPVNALFLTLARIENMLLLWGVRLPIGVTLYVVAKK